MDDQGCQACTFTCRLQPFDRGPREMETHGKDADEMGGGNDEIGHLEIEMQQWNE